MGRRRSGPGEFDAPIGVVFFLLSMLAVVAVLANAVSEGDRDTAVGLTAFVVIVGVPLYLLFANTFQWWPWRRGR